MNKHPRRITAAAATVLSLLLGLSPAGATTLLKLDLPSLTANSDRVIVGRVESLKSKRADGRIVTDVKVRVVEQLKGASTVPETVTVRKLGGRIGDTATRVHGTARFRVREKALLFLRAFPDRDLYGVTGMRQGKFHVAVGPDGDTEWVVPRLGDVYLLEPREGSDEAGGATRPSDLESVDARDLRMAEPAEIHESVTPVETIERRVRSTQTDGEER